MKKPKKKERPDWHCLLKELDSPISRDRGYNQAWDDHDKWLPSEGEILKITQEKLLDALQHCGDGVHWLNESERLTICNYITQAIAKRLKGKK